MNWLSIGRQCNFILVFISELIFNLKFKKQATNTALPKAEKLKAYIKELFAYDAKVYQQEQVNFKIKLNFNLTSFFLGLYYQEKSKEINDDKKRPELDAMMGGDMQQADGFDLNTSLELNSLPASKYGLRALVVPSNISDEFLKAANANTQRNVETCGVLAGKLKQNTFFVSHCVIPKQSGDSESCVTESEMDIFEAMDRLELITLGWIHVSVFF